MGKTKNSFGLILQISLAFGMSFQMFAQTPAGQMQSVDRGQTSLQLRLTMPDPSPCIGNERVRVEAVLTNVSKGNLVINKNGIAHSIMFGGRLPERLELGVKTKSVIGDALGGQRQSEILLLRPQETVVVPFSISLRDPFFDSPGVYTISIRYAYFDEPIVNGTEAFVGSTESNEVLFRANSCQGATK